MESFRPSILLLQLKKDFKGLPFFSRKEKTMRFDVIIPKNSKHITSDNSYKIKLRNFSNGDGKVIIDNYSYDEETRNPQIQTSYMTLQDAIDFKKALEEQIKILRKA